MVVKVLAYGLALLGIGVAAGGGAAATSHAGAELFNRRMGYKKGEGPLTKKACDGIGFVVHEQSPSEAGQCIAQLECMKKFHGQYFSLTESEGKALDEMVQPLKSLIEVRGKLVRDLVLLAMRGDAVAVDEVQAELFKLDTAIEGATKPLSRMLASVPSSRRRHIPGA